MIRFFALFRRPTPGEYVARQLADAKLHRLRAYAELEQHTAYCEMLERRIARLQSELTAIATEETPS